MDERLRNDVPHGTTCPFCGYVADYATLAELSDLQDAPEDGDISMCLDCGEFAIFEEAAPGGLRKPTDKEYGQFGTDQNIKDMRRAWTLMDADRRRDDD